MIGCSRSAVLKGRGAGSERCCIGWVVGWQQLSRAVGLLSPAVGNCIAAGGCQLGASCATHTCIDQHQMLAHCVVPGALQLQGLERGLWYVGRVHQAEAQCSHVCACTQHRAVTCTTPTGHSMLCVHRTCCQMGVSGCGSFRLQGQHLTAISLLHGKRKADWLNQ
jgi:hypothetical protein